MNLKKTNKAQIAIEYIVFIAIFLLFFQAIIYPSTTFAENIVQDVYALTQTKNNIDKLSDNIEGFANSIGYGKRTMFFYIPKNTTITNCDNSTKEINYEVNISDQQPKPSLSNCNSSTNICTFTKKLYIGNTTLDCDVIGPGFSGAIVIEKDEISGDIDVYPSP